MLSFALFAAAFLARPLGGWLFGRKADSDGRRTPLIISAALMGVSTMAIAFLPDYQTIGVSATIGLLLLRIGQGLALGGELNNSAMFLVEHEAKNKPLFTGSWIACCGASGMFLGGAIAATLQLLQIDWLWRPIFVVVGFASLWVCRLRKKLQESPEFVPNHTSVREIIKEEWPGILNIAALAAFVSVTVYLCNAFWVSYATDQGFWAPATCAWAGSIAQLLSALLGLPIAFKQPPSQVNSLLRASMFCAFITAPVLFTFTAHGYIPGILLGLCLYILTNTLLCSSMFYFLYLQLPAKYRCRGVSTVWALAATCGAACLPLAEQANQLQMPWVAPACICFFALLAYVVLFKKTPVHAHAPG